MCRSTAEHTFMMTCVPHTCLSPVTSGKEPSDFTMLPVGGFRDCFTAGPSPRDLSSVGVAWGQGWAIRLWRDKQNSQRGDGHPHPSGLSPVVKRKPSGCPALQWEEKARCPHRQGVRDGQVLRQARNEGRGDYLRARGPPLNRSHEQRRVTGSEHETLDKRYPFDWLTSRGRQTPEDREMGSEEERVWRQGSEYTWGRLGALGGPKRLFLPPASHSTGPCVVLLDMQMQRVREHFKTSGMKFKIESCQIIGTQV